MKNIILLFTLLFSYAALAQSGDAKVDKMLKELQEQQKAPGKIVFTMNGKKTTEVASFIEDAKKGFVISSHLTLDTTPEATISLATPAKKTGSYTIEGNKAGVLQINGKTYQIKGTIVLKINGKKVSGTFSGELYEVLKNKSKASDTSSGKITGNFTN